MDSHTREMNARGVEPTFLHQEELDAAKLTWNMS